MIHGLGLAVGSGLERDELLERIYRYLRKFVVFDTFAVVFCDPSQDELSWTLPVKEARSLDVYSFLTHDQEPQTRRVLTGGKPLLVAARHGRAKSSQVRMASICWGMPSSSFMKGGGCHHLC